MKIVAMIKGYTQVSPESFQETRKAYIFDSSASIDDILRVTGEKDITQCNLAPVEEAQQ